MSRRCSSLCSFYLTSCHFLSLRAKLSSPCTPFSVSQLCVPLMSEAINPSPQWVSPLPLVNHQYHPTIDRTGVQSHCDDKNHAPIRQACRHIRVSVNMICQRTPTQTVPSFTKISPNATDGCLLICCQMMVQEHLQAAR
jgi:hypothetical protein